MADKRISQLIERVDIANNDVLPIVASGATTTNKVTISTIQDWMQENLDVGVTSVGITIGSTGTDVNVTGSPITTSGNITINIPTASATNRGLLSAADWSTFNGKQNSITLTTSGTSGAATLVGSTLNIPNYSTGVANAYVPYVGAIGSVSLGYNALSASQINIDGASPTGGSYLGFKHSTSVNTGTDGYTSMYTFGTNTIGFQSTSGGTSKAFAFSMVGITAGVPGGRQYTLPDASGTLALTSDLSGYVTLGTAQTITAQKTFTTSGGDDTLIVNHTSGSGIAVDISKAGNGEGLRVAKTSGSGNAVTITGGLLSAEAATLTGALNGTSASFTGDITTNGTCYISPASGNALNVISRTSTANGAGLSLRTNTTTNWLVGTAWGETSSNFVLYNSGTGTQSLKLDYSTNAATFSSSVGIGAAPTGTYGTLSVSGGVSIKNDNLAKLEIGRYSVGAPNSYIKLGPNSNSLRVTNNTDLADIFVIENGGNVGIGTASPTTYSLAGRHLEVNDAGGGYAFIHSNTTSVKSFFAANESGALAALFTFSNHPLTFGTNNTERMRITSGGNVGIGVTNPSESLTIAGGIELTNGGNRQITIGSSTNYNYRLGTDGDDFRILEASTTERLRYSYLNTRWTMTSGLTVTGSLSKGSGSFKIDHPLPEKKDTHHLVHSFVEAPQADNIYRGKIELVDGYAEVNIDEVSGMTEGTFVLLNGNIQCFTSNEEGWTAIRGKVDGNILKIEAQDSKCTDTISWLVIGERIDQHMIDTDWTDENGKVIVEPLKEVKVEKEEAEVEALKSQING